MAIYLNLILAAIQSADPAEVTDEVAVDGSGDWWTSFVIGDTAGVDWLLLLGGVFFFGIVGYGVYSMMLYNWTAINRHPANFRRVITAAVLMLSIGWFTYVFFHAFGGMTLLVLFVVWLVMVVVFIATRRKVTLSQS